MANIEETEESLERIQNFDAGSLERADTLGAAYKFSDIVEPARNIVALFNKISVTALPEFPDNELNTIKSQADSVFNLFSEILDFDPKIAWLMRKSVARLFA